VAGVCKWFLRVQLRIRYLPFATVLLRLHPYCFLDCARSFD
jgi:hypothetical protein